PARRVAVRGAEAQARAERAVGDGRDGVRDVVGRACTLAGVRVRALGIHEAVGDAQVEAGQAGEAREHVRAAARAAPAAGDAVVARLLREVAIALVVRLDAQQQP